MSARIVTMATAAGVRSQIVNWTRVTLLGLTLVSCGGKNDDGNGGGNPPPGPPASFSVSASVAGLAGAGLVLRNNGGDDLAVSVNGSVTFTERLTTGAAYNVSIAVHPTGPTQTCVISNPAGSIGSANVSNISVTCATNTYTVGGMVSGLAGTGLELSLNGGDAFAVAGNGSFSIPAAIASGTNYTVAVVTQPANPSQVCAVSNGAGTVVNAAVVSVQISCAISSASVGGAVTGMLGSGLQLSNNGDDLLTLNVNGTFTFGAAVPLGSTYNVTVAYQPRMPRQDCTVANGAGVASGSISDVQVVCAFRPGNLRMQIPSQTYVAGSHEESTFFGLNTARQLGLFGLVAQNTQLDAAARAHARYIVNRHFAADRFDVAALSAVTPEGAVVAHVEQSGASGFTGVLPADRGRAAGYAWADGVEATIFNVGYVGGPGIVRRDCSDQLLDSLTLRQRFMNVELRDIGIAVENTNDGKGFVCVVLAAYADVRGEAPGGWVGVYPSNGETDVSIAMASDSTGEAYGKNRGVPILYMSDRNAPLMVTSLTLRKLGGSSNIGGATVTNFNRPTDVNSNQAYFVPAIYLDQDTTYEVRMVGTVDALPVDMTSTFTTGARSHSSPFVSNQGAGSVRAIYAIPTDRLPNQAYGVAVRNALEHLQGWYQQQLGGETFQIYSYDPQVCPMAHPSSYYFDNTWNKVVADVQACAPARFGDPDYSWVIYADVNHGCGLPGRLGAGADTLTLLPRADLEGLIGNDTGIDDCNNSFPIFSAMRFIGGLGHELGHSLNLPHPPGCEAGQSTCDGNSIMWSGVYAYPRGHFNDAERASLLNHRFINLQRFAL